MFGVFVGGDVKLVLMFEFGELVIEGIVICWLKKIGDLV